MEARKLPSINDIYLIHVRSSWMTCTLALEHAVSGDYYWLESSLTFSRNNERVFFVSMGPCRKDEPKIIVDFLEAAGFASTGRRFMREWEYTDFHRVAYPD